MEERIIGLIKEQPIIVPRVIFNNYKKLNITEEELIIIICMINLGNKIKYDPEIFVNELNMDKYKVMGLISNLEKKNILSIEVITNNLNKKEEYLSLDLLYNKILGNTLNKKVIKDSQDIFVTFETELGRTLSPMEYTIINKWLEMSSKELINEALREAVYNGVNNLRYIEKIIFEWKKKGYKTKDDIIKDKEKHRQAKKEKMEVFDYNWLDEE